MPKRARPVAAGSLPLAAFDSLTHSASPPFRMRPVRGGRMINTTRIRGGRWAAAASASGLAAPASASGGCGACSALCAWNRPGNDPTSKAIPRIAARICPLIIRLAMDD
jgi:hypothetical protein